MGKGECSMRLTVASRVSDQPSIGPRGVFDQLWASNATSHFSVPGDQGVHPGCDHRVIHCSTEGGRAFATTLTC